MSNSQHTMISAGAAFVWADYSSFIHSEAYPAGLNSDGDGLSINGSFELIGIVAGNINYVCDSHSTTSTVRGDLARLHFLSRISILVFGFKSVLLCISESVERITSETSCISVLLVYTVKQLLFRKLNELTVIYEILTFHDSSGCESPAISFTWELVLVLDRCDCPFILPVTVTIGRSKFLNIQRPRFFFVS
jgi:hypothetical protein